MQSINQSAYTSLPVWALLQSAGKGQRGNLVRCGQCHMCRNPLMKKPCLHPIVPRGFEGSDEGTSAPK